MQVFLPTVPAAASAAASTCLNNAEESAKSHRTIIMIIMFLLFVLVFVSFEGLEPPCAHLGRQRIGDRKKKQDPKVVEQFWDLCFTFFYPSGI